MRNKIREYSIRILRPIPGVRRAYKEVTYFRNALREVRSARGLGSKTESQQEQISAFETVIEALNKELDIARARQPDFDLIRSELELLRRLLIPAQAETTSLQTLRSQNQYLGELYLEAVENSLMSKDPANALSEVKITRLRNLRHLLQSAMRDAVAGDVLEIGPGDLDGCLYLCSVLAAAGEETRNVYSANAGRVLSTAEEFQSIKKRHKVMEKRAVSLPGHLEDWLTRVPFKNLSMLRIVGAEDETASAALEALCPKVSEGGFIIVENEGSAGLQAVRVYREKSAIDAPLNECDGLAWWRVPVKE